MLRINTKINYTVINVSQIALISYGEQERKMNTLNRLTLWRIRIWASSNTSEDNT